MTRGRVFALLLPAGALLTLVYLFMTQLGSVDQHQQQQLTFGLSSMDTKLLIGVGCQKCEHLSFMFTTFSGTTSLFYFLRALSWATTPKNEIKELHFFDRHIQKMKQGVDPGTLRRKYLSLWPEEREQQTQPTHSPSTILVEVTPAYMVLLRSPWLMQQVLGKEDLIPTRSSELGTPEEFHNITQHYLGVSRACDHLLQQPKGDGQCVSGLELDPPFLECFTEHCHMRCFSRKYPHLFLTRGLYVSQIRNFLCAGFSPEQMIFFASHELAERQMDVLRRISEFVGRPLEFKSEEDKEAVTSGLGSNHKSEGDMTDETKSVLREFYGAATKELMAFLEQGNFRVDMAAMRKEMEDLLTA
ncbi:hypothetical protein QOT17_001748 [Balamuthia mandrillaris]